jgi:hypothetical protein
MCAYVEYFVVGVEYFVVDSWVEDIRQRGRETLADNAVYEHARIFHVGDGTPRSGIRSPQT